MRAHIDNSVLYAEMSTLFKYLNNNNNNNQTALKKDYSHFLSKNVQSCSSIHEICTKIMIS